MIKTAVFVAAGMGIRLKEKTKNIPKGLLPLAKKSLMGRSVEKLIASGIEKIYIGTGYLSEQYDEFAKKYPKITTIKSEKYATTSSMYTLYNMRDFIKEDFLLLESDLLYDKKALDEILKDENKDIILAGGRSFSGDEVFIDADENHIVRKMSKNANELKVFGELVGISKISIAAYKEMCEIFIAQQNEKVDYEYIMTACKIEPFFVKKIEDLVFCEIDDKHHMQRAIEKILPKIE